jgi:hypothetical protein
MRPVGIAEQILRIWEHGADHPRADRTGLALNLLTSTDTPASALYAEDAAAMALLISLFGARLDVLVHCPQCGADFDLSLDLANFLGPVAEAAPVSVEWHDFAAVVRPPRRQDLVDIGPGLSPAEFASALFARCVEEAMHLGRPVEPCELPTGVRSAAATALSSQGMEGPTADLQCGACRNQWRAPLDAAGALLRKIDERALRLLDEVHRIASAYHWSERDILGLSPARRRFYLEAMR